MTLFHSDIRRHDGLCSGEQQEREWRMVEEGDAPATQRG